MTSELEHLAAGHHFLGFLVEGDALTGAGRGVGHDGGDGVLIARLDRGVGAGAAGEREAEEAGGELHRVERKVVVAEDGALVVGLLPLL